MSDQNKDEEMGMGAKIGFFLMVLAGTAFYYLVALNWLLMVPVQNLPYPYK